MPTAVGSGLSPWWRAGCLLLTGYCPVISEDVPAPGYEGAPLLQPGLLSFWWLGPDLLAAPAGRYGNRSLPYSWGGTWQW